MKKSPSLPHASSQSGSGGPSSLAGPSAPGAGAHEDTKAQLIRAAKPLFAKHGLEGTTVRDIAASAKINLAMVSYHFDGKEGLYRACIEEYGKARLEVARELLTPVSSEEEFRVRLKLVIASIFSSYFSEPDVHKMIVRECESGLPIAKDVFERTLFKLIDTLMDFFRAGQKAQIVRADLDAGTLAALIHGTIGHMVRMTTVYREYFGRNIDDLKQRDKVINTLFEVLMKGTLA